MQVRGWLDRLSEDIDGDYGAKLRIILKAGNEVEIVWFPELDKFGSGDEISHGDYMIDARSIAAIQFME